MSVEYLHVSQRMAPNPLRWTPGAASLPPFIRDGAPSTYRCRDGQVRGKAAVKSWRRYRMANRMLHFRTLCWWCSGNSVWLEGWR